jgi:DNA-binding PadR family transcriptional regulator
MTRRRHHRHGPPFGFGGPPFRFRIDGPRARRGDIRTAALLLLAEEPRNGYQLMQELEERSGGVWRPSPGSVYPALSQLEDEGLVRVEEVDGRKAYALTDAGRESVEKRNADAASPWDEMGGAIDDDVASLFTEIRQVGMAAAQVGHIGGSRQVEQARTILASTRRSLYALLAEDDPSA